MTFKISDLPSSITTGGAVPIDSLFEVEASALGASGKATGSQLKRLTSGSRYPKRICWVGDSIASLFAKCSTSSPLFWAQCATPRDYGLEFNDMDFGAPGTSSSNILTQVTAVRALDPDIIFYLTGMNDQGQAIGYVSGNVTSFRSSVKARQNVIIPTTPNTRTTTPELINQVNTYRSLAFANADTIVSMFPHQIMLDDASSGFLPIGGSGGGATAMTRDGTHFSAVAGQALGPKLDALMASLGVPLMELTPAFTGDSYNATTFPNGNIVINGNMAGTFTAGAIFTPATGTLAPSWGNNPSESAGMTTVYSADTITLDGTAHAAIKMVTTATGGVALATSSNISFRGTTVPLPNIGGAPVKVRVCALIEITSCTKLSSINLQIGYQKSAANITTVFGSAYIGTTASEYLNFGSPKVLQMCLPGYLLCDAGTQPSFKISMTFNAGDIPSATIKLAQASITILP